MASERDLQLQAEDPTLSLVERLARRIEDLETGTARVGLKQLPIQALQERLLQTWQPEGDNLLLPGSVGPDSLTDPILSLLAQPVQVGDAGGTLLAGAASAVYLCNKDSTPKLPGTLVNQVLETFYPDAPEHVAPPGFRTEWKVSADWMTNATNPGSTWGWGLRGLATNGGGAGGYTQTITGVTDGPITAAVGPTGGRGRADGTWQDDAAAWGVTGKQLLRGYYVFFTPGPIAANSAVQWRMKLWRRFVLDT